MFLFKSAYRGIYFKKGLRKLYSTLRYVLKITRILRQETRDTHQTLIIVDMTQKIWNLVILDYRNFRSRRILKTEIDGIMKLEMSECHTRKTKIKKHIAPVFYFYFGCGLYHIQVLLHHPRHAAGSPCYFILPF